MFSVICDVITYNKTSWFYINGFPCKLLEKLEVFAGHRLTDNIILINMQYGKSFENLTKDPFSIDRTVEKLVTLYIHKTIC